MLTFPHHYIRFNYRWRNQKEFGSITLPNS